MPTRRNATKNPIQVVERMMRLLDLLAQHTGLHPSTAHRILSSMSVDRLVDRVEPGAYRLGMRLLELGNLVKSRIGARAPLHVTAAGKLFLLEEGFARLRDYAGRTGLAALSLSTPADRMQPQWGQLVKNTADRISRSIGHLPTTRIGVA